MNTTTTDEHAEAGWLRVLTDYLMCFSPVDAPTPGVEIKSTDEIINDLASMADMESNPVADTIASMGFRSYHSPQGIHGWLMKRIDLGCE